MSMKALRGSSKIIVTVKVSSDEYEFIDKLARALGVSKSALIRYIIRNIPEPPPLKIQHKVVFV